MLAEILGQMAILTLQKEWLQILRIQQLPRTLRHLLDLLHLMAALSLLKLRRILQLQQKALQPLVLATLRQVSLAALHPFLVLHLTRHWALILGYLTVILGWTLFQLLIPLIPLIPLRRVILVHR
jgi:hypothetical protein